MEKNKSRVIYRNPWITVREDDIVHPSGKRGIYGVVEIPPGVFVVAVNVNNKILLVRQTHYPTGLTSWELPGGGLKPKHTPEEQAEEELIEEANATVSSFKQIGQTQTQPGVTNQIDYFLFGSNAKILTHKTQALQYEEGIDSAKFFPLQEIMVMIKKGEISHGQTITGITLYLLHKKIKPEV